MKKIIGLSLSLMMVASLALAGCQTKAETPAQTNAAQTENTSTETEAPPSAAPVNTNAEYTIKIAHAVAESHASHIALLDVFKKEVEENSGGRIAIEIYPNAQLGGDRQAAEGVIVGTIEMTFCTASVLAGFEEQLTILDLPFLFTTKDSAYAALDGELGDELNSLLLNYDIKNLGFAEGGYRHITNNTREIKTPDDLKGIKIRTMENTVHVNAFKAYGANPTPMAFSELFTALQQGTVDGQENPVNLIYTSKFQEVQKYMTLSGHVYGTACLFINNDYFNSLPEDLQQILVDASKNTVDYQRKLITEQDDEYIVELKEVMEVYELTPDEKQLFVEKAQSVYADFESKFGTDLIDLATKYN